MDIMKGEKGFAGVMMNDQLPQNINKNEIWNAVINLMNTPTEQERAEGRNGTHWVCVYNDPKSHQIEYFDSYGLPPTQNVLNFLKSTHKEVVMNNSMLQRLGTGPCGYFCCYYIKKRNKGLSPYDILYSFEQNPKKDNETQVIEYNKIEGEGFLSDMVSKFISHSPFELHLPGYSFLGPGTKFLKREALGQRGINALDNGAYYHDKTYHENPPGLKRAEADRILRHKAQLIANDPHTDFLQRFYARNIVIPAMNIMEKGNIEESQK